MQTAGAGELGPIPVPVLIVVGLRGSPRGCFATRMQWGRWIYLVGGDKEAARRVGIPVDRVIISVFVISGLRRRARGADHRGAHRRRLPERRPARRAGGDLGGDHRRRELLGRARHGRRRDRRRADLRGDLQRAEPAQRQRLRAADRHRRGRVAGGRARRRPAPARGALPHHARPGRDDMAGTVLEVSEVSQAVRRHVRAARGLAGAARGRDPRPARRQRRRQVDADQDPRRRHRRTTTGEILLAGEEVRISSPTPRARAGHRDRLPGPRAVRQRERGRQLLRRARADRPVVAALARLRRRPRDAQGDRRAARAPAGQASPTRTRRSG